MAKVFDSTWPTTPRLIDRSESPILVPIDSHLITVFESGLAIAEADCGLDHFLHERRNLVARHHGDAQFLGSSSRFNWNGRIDDDRFELLVLELLGREPGMSWARKAGKSSAPDVGRDIIADWYLGPAARQQANIDAPIERRRIVVQCKALARSVNFADVGDVPSVLDFHEASGFLLVVAREITPQLIDYLTRVPHKRGFWCDWWTSAELEERMGRNLDVVKRYPDLVAVVD